jgi:hypothetical protein
MSETARGPSAFTSLPRSDGGLRMSPRTNGSVRRMNGQCIWRRPGRMRQFCNLWARALKYPEGTITIRFDKNPEAQIVVPGLRIGIPGRTRPRSEDDSARREAAPGWASDGGSVLLKL